MNELADYGANFYPDNFVSRGPKTDAYRVFPTNKNSLVEVCKMNVTNGKHENTKNSEYWMIEWLSETTKKLKSLEPVGQETKTLSQFLKLHFFKLPDLK